MHLSKSSRWTRRQALWTMAGAIAGIGLHGCTNPAGSGSPQSSASGSPSTSASGGNLSASIGITTWIGNTPLHIAQAKGFFKDLGLNLDIKVFDTVAQAFPAFTAGQLSGVAPVTSEAVTLAAKNVDFKIVMVEDTSLGADVILARNSIKNIQDFKGKKIGVELGGIGHFFVLQVLTQAGLNEKDVTLVNLPPDAASAAYQKGSIDIVYSYSPFSDKANTTQKDGRTIYSSKQMPTAIADLYVFSTKFIEANPKAVAAFVEGNFKGLQFLKENPKEGLAIAAKQLGVTPDELQQQLLGVQLPDLATNIEMLSNPNSELFLLKPMTKLAQFLKDQGQVQTLPDLSQYVDPQFVKTLKA